MKYLLTIFILLMPVAALATRGGVKDEQTGETINMGAIEVNGKTPLDVQEAWDSYKKDPFKYKAEALKAENDPDIQQVEQATPVVDVTPEATPVEEVKPTEKVGVTETPDEKPTTTPLAEAGALGLIVGAGAVVGFNSLKKDNGK